MRCCRRSGGAAFACAKIWVCAGRGTPGRACLTCPAGPVAQLAEQQTLNLRVEGSIPSWLTIFASALLDAAKTIAADAACSRVTRGPPAHRVPANMSHKRGAAKARLLLGTDYRCDAPCVLEADLRAQHVSLEVMRAHNKTDRPNGLDQNPGVSCF